MSLPVTNPNRTRLMLQKLAKQKHRCLLCGRPLALSQANFDHIRPRSKGGKNRQSNLAAVHIDCNARKGNEYDQKLREPRFSMHRRLTWAELGHDYRKDCQC
jgi:5-methylcytosine-specific restriction endonuclease McrA